MCGGPWEGRTERKRGRRHRRQWLKGKDTRREGASTLSRDGGQHRPCARSLQSTPAQGVRVIRRRLGTEGRWRQEGVRRERRRKKWGGGEVRGEEKKNKRDGKHWEDEGKERLEIRREN